MKAVQYLIIGDGVAGNTAAETIRSNDASGTIAIVSDEPHRLYSRIMLSKPNFFLKKIPFERIWLREESWYAERRIERISGKAAIQLNPAEKVIIYEGGEQIKYEKLLLAIGCRPRAWQVPGADKKGIFCLRSLDDAKAIIDAVGSAKRALVVGGGFVSFEMCEMLRLAGIEVTLLLRESYFWEPILDKTSGEMVERALEKGGVTILRNTQVSQVIGDEAVQAVEIGGTKIACDMLIAGIGVFCPTSWIQSAGISTSRGILANEYLETNVSAIWTAGDAAEFYDPILGETIQLGNWVNAQMQGKTAGLNMIGKHQPFRLVSFYTAQGFGITIAFVGDVRSAQDRSIITRGSAESGSYARILAHNGEIIGATMINRTQELSIFSRLIENDFRVSGRERELSDVSLDLKKLTLIS